MDYLCNKPSKVNLKTLHLNRTKGISVLTLNRSSHPDVFCKKSVLGNFAKFTGKHQCQSLFFNKVVGLRPEACNFIKKEALAQVFSCEFCEISKNTFIIEHLWWLLLTELQLMRQVCHYKKMFQTILQ